MDYIALLYKFIQIALNKYRQISHCVVIWEAGWAFVPPLSLAGRYQARDVLASFILSYIQYSLGRQVELLQVYNYYEEFFFSVLLWTDLKYLPLPFSKTEITPLYYTNLSTCINSKRLHKNNNFFQILHRLVLFIVEYSTVIITL